MNLDEKGSVPTSAVQAKQPNHIDAQIKRVVYYAFAALASVACAGVAAVAHWGVFNISMGHAILPLAAAVAILHFASKIIDYKAPEAQGVIRAQLKDSNFVTMYREHGLSNLLDVLTVNELKQKFNAEVRDANTTFWNILRRYDIQELHQAGIITPEHLALLLRLRISSGPINQTLYPGKEQWEQNGLFDRYSKSHHVPTSFANAPEAFRMAEALDSAYKARVEAML
ncbi:MAG: hypothetical protein V4492_09425 [Chlamydiota bacterium]